MAKILASKEQNVNAQRGGTSSIDAYTFKLEVIENYTKDNLSNVTINFYAKGNKNWSFNHMSGPGTEIVVDDIRKALVDVPQINAGSYTLLVTWTGDITHNSDGKKSINVYCGFYPNNSTDYLPVSTIVAIDGIKLTDIVRGFTSTPKLTVTKNGNSNYTNETQLYFTLTTSETCSKYTIYYKKSNGSSYTTGETKTINAKSGTFKVTGLNENTSYDVYVKAIRSDSGVSNDSNVVTEGTYQYPYVSKIETSNLVIGNSQKLTLYNPLKRNVIVHMKKDSVNGTQLYSGNTTDTSITFSPNIDTLYDSIPNSQSSNAVYYCEYSGHIVQSVNGKYTINPNECTPIFTDFSFKDINNTTLNLTGNNQLLIDNYSSCQFIIGSPNSKAMGRKGASIVKYMAYWSNGKYVEIQHTDSASEVNVGTVYKGSGNILIVYAIDSRGLQTSVTKFINNISYSNPSISDFKTQRKNGVDVVTYLQAKITLCKVDWNKSNRMNDLIYVAYRVDNGEAIIERDITDTFKAKATKSEGDSIIYDLSITDELAIHANGENGGFEFGKEFDIQLVVRDGYNNSYLYELVANGYVVDGKVCTSKFKDKSGNYHVGVNCMPDENHTLVVDGLPVLEYEVVDEW